MAPAIVKNPTYLFMLCVTYLTFFSAFMFIIRGDALAFTSADLIVLMTGSVVTALVVAVAASVAAGAVSFGGAGIPAWKASVFGAVTFIFMWFINKILGAIPGDMPPVISFILVVPPIAGMLWALIDKTVLGGD